LIVAPGPDAGFSIRRDIGGDDVAERRLDRPPAGKPRSVRPNGMTGDAIRRRSEISAFLDFGEILQVGSCVRECAARGDCPSSEILRQGAA